MAGDLSKYDEGSPDSSCQYFYRGLKLMYSKNYLVWLKELLFETPVLWSQQDKCCGSSAGHCGHSRWCQCSFGFVTISVHMLLFGIYEASPKQTLQLTAQGWPISWTLTFFPLQNGAESSKSNLSVNILKWPRLKGAWASVSHRGSVGLWWLWNNSE